jgi:superfamily I DNA/RNA helicase
VTPTTQQAAFLTALVSTTSHLALRARAGTGKTSTILMGVSAYCAAYPTHEVQVCAFNKPIAKEVGDKITAAGVPYRQCAASTIHAMGFKLVRFALKSEVDDKKVRKIIERGAADRGGVYEIYASQIEALVGYAKDAGFGFFPDKAVGNVAAWHELADHFDVNGLEDTSESDTVVEAAQVVYKISLAETATVDYADMILMPLVKGLRVKYGKDLIIVDEAQDLSPSKQALVRKFLHPRTGRLVIVGDDRQAIYGFAGADAEAMPNLIASLGAVVLPLSVTWRCPRAVVDLAQRLVPDIEAAPGAAEGVVREVHKAEDVEALLLGLGPDDAILCRNTAPLISTAYKLLRAGKPCKVEGRAIGDGLIDLAQRWKVKSIASLFNKLEAYQDREVQKAQAKGNEAKVEEVTDRCETLREICNACIGRGLTAVADVVAFINDLFQDGAVGVTILATYHRSKGREWDKVLLWQHSTRCPSRAARQPWQLAQEDNLTYVAVTRPKVELVFVEGGDR